MYQDILANTRGGASHYIREAVATRLRQSEREEIDAGFANMVSDPEDEEFAAYNARQVFLRLDEEEGPYGEG
ncbi:hypothetical protein BH11ARM2_BH11ARM2_03470 [soil metagenome]